MSNRTIVGCFWCGLELGAHPTCGHPACENDVHGDGAAGKRSWSYCRGCRDGGS